MGLMNKSLFELIGLGLKNTAKEIYKGGKYLVKDAFYEGAGVLDVTKNVIKKMYNVLKSNSSHFFEETSFKDADNFFQGVFGKRWKKGHLGESGILKKAKDFKILDFGDKFADGSKVGFIPKAIEAIVNAPIRAVTSLPMKALNNTVLSPGGRLGLGIAGIGLLGGAYKGISSNTLANAEEGNLAHLTSQITSPILEDDTAVERVKMGLNNHGAEGNLVMALHNLRNGGY